MLLKQLKYFITIVDCNSFTEAAEECYISQSAISQQIQSLEADLGYKIIIREKRTFSLTPAGKFLYQQAKNILDEVEKMKETAKYIANSQNYSLKLGCLKNYNGQELNNALIKFSQDYKDVDITIKTGTHNELSEKLFNNELDIKFSDQRRAFSEEYINFFITTQYFYVKLPITNPLSKKEIITLEEIKTIPCIIITSKDQQEIEKDFYHSILGFHDNFIFAETLEEADLLVASNKGFLPIEGNITIKTEKDNIVSIPLYSKQKQMSRNYYAFWKKDKTNPIIEKFANILKEKFE